MLLTEVEWKPPGGTCKFTINMINLSLDNFFCDNYKSHRFVVGSDGSHKCTYSRSVSDFKKMSKKLWWMIVVLSQVEYYNAALKKILNKYALLSVFMSPVSLTQWLQEWKRKIPSVGRQIKLWNWYAGQIFGLMLVVVDVIFLSSPKPPQVKGFSCPEVRRKSFVVKKNN